MIVLKRFFSKNQFGADLEQFLSVILLYKLVVCSAMQQVIS